MTRQLPLEAPFSSIDVQHLVESRALSRVVQDGPAKFLSEPILIRMLGLKLLSDFACEESGNHGYLVLEINRDQHLFLSHLEEAMFGAFILPGSPDARVVRSIIRTSLMKSTPYIKAKVRLGGTNPTLSVCVGDSAPRRTLCTDMLIRGAELNLIMSIDGVYSVESPEGDHAGIVMHVDMLKVTGQRTESVVRGTDRNTMCMTL